MDSNIPTADERNHAVVDRKVSFESFMLGHRNEVKN